MQPLRDDVFQYLLGEALVGRVPLYAATIPLPLIRPFDSEYEPAKHPAGEAAIIQTMTEWRAGVFVHVWVYPKEDHFVLSDDYIIWEAAQRGQPDHMPCWVMGYPTLDGVLDIQGPIDEDDVYFLAFGVKKGPKPAMSVNLKTGTATTPSITDTPANKKAVKD